MDNHGLIKSYIEERKKLLSGLVDSSETIKKIEEIVEEIINCFNDGGKLLLCGNGGSAADAQHLAAEFTGRFYLDRKPLYAEALHVNSSYMTAVANDISFDEAYSRLIEAKGRKGDILIALSTSGNSLNVINAAKRATSSGLKVIGLTGESGGILAQYCDLVIKIPSDDTPAIQEMHILVGHIICQIVEEKIFGDGK